MSPIPLIPANNYDAVLFDLDGVLTKTAAIHAACWKEMFDAYLRRRAAATDTPFVPFDVATDYAKYVDGKPRYDGVRSFLHSRGIDLPEGTAADPPGYETVCGLGNRKDQLVKEAIAAGLVETFPASVDLVRRLRAAGLRTAVVSSSQNCAAILESAGIDGLFDARVDGVTAAELGLPGKPEPDTFLQAAELLGVEPRRAVVVEDAIAGVQAGRAGGFGLVLGVDRLGQAEDLRRNGADVVVQDLGELLASQG